MGETPNDIRVEIEETRARMGETVDAIGYKTDVKTRVKDSVGSKKDAVVGTLSSGKDAVVGGADSLVSRVGGVVPDREQVKTGAQKVGISSGNPLGLALVGAAAGFIVGTLVPSTRIEDERMGAVSDQVVDKAKEAGHEAVDAGKQVAQDAVQSATETVQEHGQQQAQELASNLQEKAQEVKTQATS
jgi:gas vesicle protein